MKTKNYVLIGSGLALGLMAALSIGVTQDTAAAAEAPQERLAGAAGVEPSEPLISLDEVVTRFEQKYKGKVTDIELDRELTRDVYEMEVSDSQGYEWDVEIDARNGEVLKEKRERDD